MDTIKLLIWRTYKFFWYSVFQLREPLTAVLSRMVVAGGAGFWAAFLLIQGWLFWHLFTGPVWQQVLSVIGLMFMLWLIDHLVDFVREHPENTPNPSEAIENKIW